MSYIYEKNIDICGIIETFIQCPVNANHANAAPIPNRTGGEVAIVFREDIVVSKI